MDEHGSTGVNRTLPRVPRREEGGASAPPDAYASYLAAYHGPTPPLSRLAWTAKHYRDQLEADTAAVQPVVNPRRRESDRTPTDAEAFCLIAAGLVGGPRAATHGDKLINFANIAELWNGYWRILCRVNGEPLSTPFTAKNVGDMMELFKIARRFSGSFNADDYIDAAGYAGCTGEIAARDDANKHS